MSPPEKREPGLSTRADATTATVTGTNSSTAPTVTGNAGAYGVMMNRPLTTTRTCAGAYCWCRVGSTVAWPLDHLDEMARMAHEIRALEIRQGVQI